MYLNTLNCLDIYRSVYGTSAIGNLKIYQLVTDNVAPNPYEDLPVRPILILDTECVSVKSMYGKSNREDYGLNTTQVWRITINGDIEPEQIPLNSYALVAWNNQVIKGTISNIERKLTNRYYLYIDTSKTLPFTHEE